MIERQKDRLAVLYTDIRGLISWMISLLIGPVGCHDIILIRKTIFTKRKKRWVPGGIGR
jgi:hypothetical protein